jgi:hypothetical protein
MITEMVHIHDAGGTVWIASWNQPMKSSPPKDNLVDHIHENTSCPNTHNPLEKASKEVGIVLRPPPPPDNSTSKDLKTIIS